MTRVTVINKSTGTVLAHDARLANTFSSRLFGLMGRRKLRPGEALVLLPCNAVHSWFMRFPIDVLFLEARGTVVGQKMSLRPFQWTRPIKGAVAAVELPAGSLEITGTKLGDTVIWSQVKGG